MSTQEDLAGVRAGDVLAGKYRVDKVLGVGGMGVVVAAHHLQLDDRVAIKFLLPATLMNSDTVMRFAREARAAVRIKSEHVARVIDVGTLEGGAPFMVMEYLEGEDLAALLASRGPLAVELAVDFLLQGCEAIAEAHAKGIVHRDLKPANLFVARLPGGIQSVKVLDFGISKVTGLGGSSATKTSALMGSPLYMSPEQMQSSKDVDARGDIWALGVILYELLTGVSPFLGESMPELILKIMNGTPVPVRAHRPDAPAELEAVIVRCLEKDRGKRYQTVAELAAALRPFGSKRALVSADRISQVMQRAGAAPSAGMLPPSTESEPTLGARTAASFGATIAAPGQKSRFAFGLAALALLLGVGGIAFAGVAQAPGAEKVTVVAARAAAGAPEMPSNPAAEAAVVIAADIAPSAPAASKPAEAASAPEISSKPARRASPSRNGSSAHVASRAGVEPVRPAVAAAPVPAPALTAKKASAIALIDDRR